MAGCTGQLVLLTMVIGVARAKRLARLAETCIKRPGPASALTSMRLDTAQFVALALSLLFCLVLGASPENRALLDETLDALERLSLEQEPKIV